MKDDHDVGYDDSYPGRIMELLLLSGFGDIRSRGVSFLLQKVQNHPLGKGSSDLDRRGEKLQESKLFGGWTE